MTRKKEDDNGKPRYANESKRINPFADWLVHVELEQLSKCSRFQLKPGKGIDVLSGILLFFYYMIRSFSEQNLVVLLFSCTISYDDNDNEVE